MNDLGVDEKDAVKWYRKSTVNGKWDETIAKSQANSNNIKYGASALNKKRLLTLMALYDEEVTQIHGDGDYGRKGAKGSLWCAYQAATAWSTHLRDVEGKVNKPHIVRSERENHVRKMINSPLWKELEVA